MTTKPRKKTYTNTKDRTMLLVEVGKSLLTKDGIEVGHFDDPREHHVEAGESITLSRGVRRVWRKM